jgi:hypothetical protein
MRKYLVQKKDGSQVITGVQSVEPKLQPDWESVTQLPESVNALDVLVSEVSVSKGKASVPKKSLDDAAKRARDKVESDLLALESLTRLRKETKEKELVKGDLSERVKRLEEIVFGLQKLL